MTVNERFQSKISVSPSGCHLWTGATNGDGYGRFHLDGVNRKAHQVAYEMAKGPIPPGMMLDHLCRVRNCCNPEHLEAVTARTNVLRGTAPSAGHATKTHCKHGHLISGSNLIAAVNGARRRCRACNAAEVRARRLKQRQKSGDS
jgi:hypothetical protein